MFVNPKILKKLMKEAFKANFLIIGRNDEKMYIQGNYWRLLCDRKFIPKTIYAEIIELAGEIPEEGECFCAGKEGNQMQINPMVIDLPENAKEVAVTDLVLIHKTGAVQRILQFVNGRVVLISERIWAATIGSHNDEKEGETQAAGPFCSLTHGVFWTNNTGIFHVVFRQDEEHESMLENMASVDLTEKVETFNG